MSGTTPRWATALSPSFHNNDKFSEHRQIRNGSIEAGQRLARSEANRTRLQFFLVFIIIVLFC